METNFMPMEFSNEIVTKASAGEVYRAPTAVSRSMMRHVFFIGRGAQRIACLFRFSMNRRTSGRM